MPRFRDVDAIYWKTLREAERSMIEFYLDNGYSIIQAAEVLGVSYAFLYTRIRKVGLGNRIQKK